MRDKIFTLLIVLFMVVGLYLSLRMVREMNNINSRIDRSSYEYQLILDDDDSVTIFDKGRYVGTVDPGPALDSLLIQDNL